ncbi:MAG: DUF2309 domain-containing protein [Leptospiraceae bacterium]|nr:DUF2309 domain-containing protein [Leptospiraceae bacterium]
MSQETELQDASRSMDAGLLKRLESALSIVAPSWPLQSVAAVNPFWYLRDRSFFDVVTELSPVIHASLFMPLQYYMEEFSRGTITDASVTSVLAEQREHWTETPANLDDLLQLSRGSDALIRRYPSVAEQLQANQYWHRCVVHDLGKMASAYLDDQQALAPFPFQDLDFWHAFGKIIEYDRAMEAYGAHGFREHVKPLLEYSNVQAIEKALSAMGLVSEEGQSLYLQRLLASVLGWATQFRFLDWQSGLGYDVPRKTTLLDLLAVRIAYDYGLFQFAQESDFAPALSFWQTSYNEVGHGERTVHGYRLHYIWQCAQERSFQKRIQSRFSGSPPDKPGIQMAFCIDVRSEVIRRRLESEIPELATIGFAGFFGLPLAYEQKGEKRPSYRLPVLLSPGFHVREKQDSRGRKSLNANMIISYFRNLRKAPISSFLFVELFGLLSVENVIRQTFHSLMRKFRGLRLPQRFDDSRTSPDSGSMTGPDGELLTIDQKCDMAQNVLRNMGLLNEMAELVILVGHGSDTTNNAFSASLDCGACGGHAGDINARLLSDLLNAADIRETLKARGVTIPESTLFVPAIHETVTDRIHILDEDLIPREKRKKIQDLKRKIDAASARARKERSVSRSAVLDPHYNRRPRNWAEVRPEWGLTGNGCFVVAPRFRTRNADLGGRAFLHDYDYRKDDGLKTLELIMTAPMVVTNWINMQYYCSSVAPEVYGAGSKVLHNLVNESGVQEGNGGDLRVGLPIQSVHDGEKLAHEPLRLSVFIEAPAESLESIIAKHDVVRQLIENGWIHLLQIDPTDGTVRRRRTGGQYVDN